MRSDRNAVVALRSVDLAGNFSEPAPLVLGMPRGRVLLIAAVLGVLGLSVLGVRRLRR